VTDIRRDTFRERAGNADEDICPRCISYSVLVLAPILYQRTVHFIIATRYHCSTKMIRAVQHGKIPFGSLGPVAGPIISVSSAASASRASRVTNQEPQITDPAFLIATLPRIEIVATRSFKRRKHFLIATRPAYSGSTATSVRPAEVCKINRNIKLIESPVTHSRQRAEHQINRNISGCSFVHTFRVSPVTTQHFPVRTTNRYPGARFVCPVCITGKRFLRVTGTPMSHCAPRAKARKSAERRGSSSNVQS
jgi:hypothetical protein